MNLSISSSENLAKILRYAGQTGGDQLLRDGLFLALLLAALWGFFRLRRHIPKFGKLVLMLIWYVLLLRFLFFNNPVCWAAYYVAFTPDTIGWRQFDVIKNRLVNYRIPLRNRGLRALAVGSSQTGAIYFNARNQDLESYTIAGMGPLDFVLYSRDIFRFRPRIVLLYLSDFDMLTPPQPEALSLAPAQSPATLFFIRELYHRMGDDSAFQQNFVRLSLAPLLPELKYSYIFHGLADRLAGPDPQAGVPVNVDLFNPDRQQVHLRQLEDLKRSGWLDFNLACLVRFFDLCASHGVSVIIAEGQYHPRAAQNNTGRIKRTREALQRLSGRYADVTYIPREQLYEFRAEDYRDGYHVHPAAGDLFVRGLLDRLEILEAGAGF